LHIPDGFVQKPNDTSWQFGSKAHFDRHQTIDSIGDDLGHVFFPCASLARLAGLGGPPSGLHEDFGRRSH
jgi:hypothetical protein